MLNFYVFLENVKNTLLLEQMLNVGVFEKHEKCTFAKTYAKFRCFSWYPECPRMGQIGLFEKREKCTFAKTDAKFRCFSKNAHVSNAHVRAKCPYLGGVAHTPPIISEFWPFTR